MDLYVLQSIATRAVYVGFGTNYRKRYLTHKAELLRGFHKSRKLTDHIKKYGLDDLKVKLLETTEDSSKERELAELVYAVAPEQCLNTRLVRPKRLLSADRGGRKAEGFEKGSNFDVI
jgi:hypothetical protein